MRLRHKKLLLVHGKIRAAEKFGSPHRREASTSMAHRTDGFRVEHREASTSMAHRTDSRVVQLRVVREVAIRGIARQLMRFLRVCEVSSFILIVGICAIRTMVGEHRDLQEVRTNREYSTSY